MDSPEKDQHADEAKVWVQSIAERMMGKPGDPHAAEVWAQSLSERTVHALVQTSTTWLQGALKGEYGSVVTVGANFCYPVTATGPYPALNQEFEVFRCVAATLDEDGSVWFIAYKSDAVASQLPHVKPIMFADNHYEVWF